MPPAPSRPSSSSCRGQARGAVGDRGQRADSQLQVTGHGQRATLSAVIGEAQGRHHPRQRRRWRGRLVLPGDRVDVMLSPSSRKNAAVNDVVLKNARVLAVDQLADDRSEKPSVAKAVTLRVDIAGAAELALGAQIEPSGSRCARRAIPKRPRRGRSRWAISSARSPRTTRTTANSRRSGHPRGDQ